MQGDSLLMNKENGNEYLTKIKRSVPKKARGKIEQAYNTADDGKREKLNNLRFVRLSFDVLNGWVSIFATLLGGLMLLINIVMFAVVYPHKCSVAQGAYAIYAKANEIYNYSMYNSNIYGREETVVEDEQEDEEIFSFETLNEWFISNDVECKQAITDFLQAETDCEEALKEYTEKLNEYEANLKYVNDRVNNYEKYLVDHNQDNAESNAEKFREYEQKRDGLAELKTQCDTLANDYYAELIIKADKNTVMSEKIIARYEYYPLDYKVKALNLVSTKTSTETGAYEEIELALQELQILLDKFNGAVENRIRLYNSDKAAEKSIAELDEEAKDYTAIYEAFTAAPVNYLTVDSVEIFKRYDEAQKEYDRLTEAYNEAADGEKDAASEELNDYFDNVYSPLKAKYDRNETVLGYFRLSGYAALTQKYAALSQKEEKEENDLEELQNYLKQLEEAEKLVNTYVTVKAWNVSDYDAAVVADSKDETAKYNKEAYEYWFNGICSAENLFYGFSAKRIRLNESFKVNAYSEVYEKSEMAFSYYNIESMCIWLKLRFNDLNILAGSVYGEYKAMENELYMGYLTMQDRQQIFNSFGYSVTVSSMAEWVKAFTDYDLTADEFAPFDFDDYSLEIDAEGAADITDARTLINSFNSMNAEFKNKLNNYERQMSNIYDVSVHAKEYAKSTNESAEFLRVFMIPYNSVVTAILIAYCIGLVISGVCEAKRRNYETIEGVLSEE